MRNYADGCIGITPYVESWFVEAASRKKGIGRKLVEAAKHWARANGYSELASAAELDNTLSQSAHKAIGFVEEVRVVHFRKEIQATS